MQKQKRPAEELAEMIRDGLAEDGRVGIGIGSLAGLGRHEGSFSLGL
jgi:uncharacterized protein (UPF0254 family)